MLAKKIESLQHPRVLHWAKLFKERAYREKMGAALIVGEKMIAELAQTLPLRELMTVGPAPCLKAAETYCISPAIFKKITGMEHARGMLAEVSLPAQRDVSKAPFLLVLDHVGDPGNCGTLLRSAYALGWDAVAATPGTVDFFNDKAIRAAKGASFLLPYAIASPEEIASWRTHFYIADLQGASVRSVSFSPPCALILGSEGKGPGAWTQPLGKKIHIPMRPGAESLNVASAGAILLYTMRWS